MPRNQEVIRQWRILHALETSRHGLAIDALATDLGVTTRTIRRDLDALQEAGFPLFDTRSDEGRVRWRLDTKVLGGLDSGLTLAELCALYLSRHVSEAVVGAPFLRDLSSAFAHIERLLTPRMRHFLDELPHMITAKAGPRAPTAPEQPEIVPRLLEAVLHRRDVTMHYRSVSSQREKTYRVHPYRIAFADGGLYLLAFVPEYDSVRTFAVDRVQDVSLEKETFTPTVTIGDDVFGNSLGVNTGPAAPVSVAFDASVAAHVRSREWHPSQQIEDQEDGSLLLTMDVCHDWALRHWILGWGNRATVVAPATLAQELGTEFASAAARYARPTHARTADPLTPVKD